MPRISNCFIRRQNKEKSLRIEDPRNGEQPVPLPKLRERSLSLLPLPPPHSSYREIQIEASPSRWQRFCSVLGSRRVEKVKEQKPEAIQRVVDQKQSILFTLRIEIRQMIWKEALGNGVVHITHLKNRLGHVRCVYKGDEKWSMYIHDCWGRGCRNRGRSRTPSLYRGPIYMFKDPESLLGLLKTCRIMYVPSSNLVKATC
jgi:hypothetical protein